MLKNIILSFCVLALFSGCAKDEIDPCEYDPCAEKAPNNEIQDVQNYLTANGITAIEHCSGLFYEIVSQGSGAVPGNCSVVTVQYEGRLTDGTLFDGTTTDPVSFGLNQLITGWRNGLIHLMEGGQIKLYVPPSFGYGSSGNGPVPPNAILIFTIDLIDVQ